MPGRGDGPLVLTLIRPYEDARADIGRDLVGKLERARRALRADVEARTDFRVLLLDDPGERPPADWVAPAPAWRVMVGPEGEIRELATRLRVLVWDSDPDLPGQTFMTVVADSAGVIRARLPGVDGWSERDLVGTIVAADDPSR